MGAMTPKVDLATLASQLSQIAATVRQQSEAQAFRADPTEQSLALLNDAACASEQSDLVTIAVAWVHARNARDKAFGPGLFCDPAWNMLLDLYIQAAKARPVSVTSLTIAAGTPTTTALRWITLLEDRGLIARAPDPADRRRSFVQLTSFGVGRVEEALSEAAESDRKLGLGRLQRFN